MTCPHCGLAERVEGCVDGFVTRRDDRGIASAQRCSRTQPLRMAKLLVRAGIPEQHEDRQVSGFAAIDDAARPRRVEVRDAVADWVRGRMAGTGRRGLLLWGPSGTGKTLLACAALRAVMMHHAVRGVFTDVRVWIERLHESLEKGDRRGDETTAEVVEALIAPSVLVLDELGQRAVTDWNEGFLLRVLNEHIDRPDRHQGLIVTTNLAPSPESMRRLLGERITSRLLGHCAPVSFEGIPDFRLDTGERLR